MTLDNTSRNPNPATAPTSLAYASKNKLKVYTVRLTFRLWNVFISVYVLKTNLILVRYKAYNKDQIGPLIIPCGMNCTVLNNSMLSHKNTPTWNCSSANFHVLPPASLGFYHPPCTVPPGNDITVDSSKATSLASSAGGTTAASLQELVQGTSTVITMLPNTSHVEAVYLGSHADNSDSKTIADEANTPATSTAGCNALLELVQPGTLVVDSSTIDPIASRRINAAAVARVSRQG